MSERPILSKELDPNAFVQYYYLKEELVAFCKENELSAMGGKQELTKRIEHFLKTGENLAIKATERRMPDINTKELSLDQVIEENIVCTQAHRAFFQSVIGSKFSFNVAFQEYLKHNAGKTYLDAVNEWYRLQEEKKKNKGNSPIDSQFEYNTYIRDFFKDNEGKTLKEAIRCWNYKKSLAGSHDYKKSDLSAIGSGFAKE